MWDNARLLNRLAVILGSVALVALCMEALLWCSHRPMFFLRGVRIEAEAGTLRHVDLAAIRTVALPHVRGNFFNANLEDIRLAFESVAWVRHARVRREWPDRLAVKIEEQEALGTWNDERLMNTYGEVFAANLAEAESEGELPRFFGPEGSEKDVRERYSDFVEWFAPIGLKPFEVALSPRYAWQVRLENGTPSGLSVRFGRESGRGMLKERVARLLAAYPVVTSKWPRLTLVDLRYPNGFALRADGLKLADDQKPNPKPAHRAVEARAKQAKVARSLAASTVHQI